MVLVGVNGFELELRIMLMDGFDSSPYEGPEAVVDNLAPVFVENARR